MKNKSKKKASWINTKTIIVALVILVLCSVFTAYMIIQSNDTYMNNEKPKTQHTVKFVAITTLDDIGLGTSITLDGNAKVPVVKSYNLKLSTDSEYIISFDYKTKGGTNTFRVDLYPDDLPEIKLTATTKTQHYNWRVSSTKDNMKSCYLRFFDSVQEANEKDIVISNITVTMLQTIETRKVSKSDKLKSLPMLKREGYNFLGWYSQVSGGTKATKNTVVDKNVVYYSRWEQIETYIEGSGQGYYSRTVTYKGRTFKDYKQNRMPGAIPTRGCGPVALLDIISGYNDKVTVDDIIKITGLSTSFTYINQAARSFGLTHSKLYVYKSNNPNETTVKSYTKIAIDELKKGHQLIVLVARSNMCKNGVCNGWPYDAYSWGNHFIAIIGVKKDNEHVIIFNPMESKMEEGRMEDIIRYYLPGGPQSGFVSYWK